MIHLRRIVLAAAIICLLNGCQSAPAAVATAADPFELTPILPTPPKQEVVVQVDKPKHLVAGTIMQIVEDKGVQKYIFVKFPAGGQPPLGQVGDVYADPTLAQKIGRFQIIEVYQDLCRAQITDLSFKIGQTAMAGYDAVTN